MHQEETPLQGLRRGTILDNRYEIQDVIGHGASGVVYRAKVSTLDQFVAIKVLHQDLVRDAKSLERLKREARILSRLTGSGVVSIKSANLSGEHAYLVMELLDGVSLKDYLAENGALLPRQFAAVFSDIAAALANAHQNAILHRDVKPGNIVIGVNRENGEILLAKMIDFGLSKSDSVMHEKLTTTGVIAGTPAYMSPEQCAALAVDERSDIYSLGCVMYESITGRPPFEAESQYAILQKHLAEPVAFQDQDHISESIRTMITRCMEKQPQKRYQSMQEITSILAGLDTGKLLVSTKRAFPSPNSMRNLLLVLILLGGSGTIVVLNLAKQSSQKKSVGIPLESKSNHTTERRRLGLEPFSSLMRKANFYSEQPGEKPAIEAGKLFDELEHRPDLDTVDKSELSEFYISYANLLRAHGKHERAKVFLDKALAATEPVQSFPVQRADYLCVLQRWYQDEGNLQKALACGRERSILLRDRVKRLDQYVPAVIDLCDQQIAIDNSGTTSLKTIDEALTHCGGGPFTERLLGHKAYIDLVCGRAAEYKNALAIVLASKNSIWPGMQLRALAQVLYDQRRYDEGLKVAMSAMERLKPNYAEHRYDYMHCGFLIALFQHALKRDKEALAVCDELTDNLRRLPDGDSSLLVEVDKVKTNIIRDSARKIQ